MKQVTDMDFESEVLSSSEPVVVDFFAQWCGPCRTFSPIFERIADKANGGGAKFVKCDVDQAQDMAARFGVQSIPTVMIFRDGHVLSRNVGAMTSEDFEAWIKLNN